MIFHFRIQKSTLCKHWGENSSLLLILLMLISCDKPKKAITCPKNLELPEPAHIFELKSTQMTNSHLKKKKNFEFIF